ALGQLPPGGAAVGRFVQAAAGPLPGSVLPRPLPRRPQVGVDDLRVGRVEGEGDGAGVLVLGQHLVPGLAAVAGAEDAALGVGPVGVAEHGDEHPVRVARVDQHGPDLLAVAQADVLPGLAAVGRFVHAVADRQVRPLQALAAADVNHVGVRRGDGQGADGAGRLVVEDGGPDAAVVGGLPDATVVDADEEDVGPPGHAGGADGATAAER